MPKHTTPPQAADDPSPDYQTHVADQISHSLAWHGAPAKTPGDAAKTGETSESNNSLPQKPRKRVDGALAAWAGLHQDGDAIEAMLAAQIVVTHELAMTTMGIAVTNADTSRIRFGSKVSDACKIARANLQQVETLARYRTWRRRMERDALQYELGDHP